MTTELVTVPLASLQIAPNVRLTVTEIKALAQSITQHGVLVPVIVRESVLGGYEVIDGQRRVLAAREAGLEEVPAVVTHAIHDDADRIVTQIVTNDSREKVSPWETAQAVRQMSLLGVPVAQISKQIGASKAVVSAALEVSADKENESLFAQDQELDLVQAAQIARFTGHADLVSTLLKTANTPDFTHALARATQDLEARDRIAELSDRYAEQGYEVFTAMSSRINETSTKRLDDLCADAGSTTVLTPDQHTDCPGRAVLVLTYYGPPRVHERHYCTTWKTAGHYVIAARPSSGATSGEQSEEKKAERRHTIDMNKKADAAMTVHETWLQEFFGRPLTATPKDLHVPATRIITALLDSGRQLWTSDAKKYLDTAAATTPHATGRYLLAIAVGAVQRYYTRDYWRSTYEQSFVLPFLDEIAELGYPLADFEQDLLDGKDDTGA